MQGEGEEIGHCLSIAKETTSPAATIEEGERYSPGKADQEALERLEQSINEPRKILARAFLLDSNNEWMTVATGEALYEHPEESSTLNISLQEDNTPHVRAIFSASFHAQQEIIRQQPTVITWTASDGTDVALSFENEEGCDVFWAEMCRFLGKPLEYTIPDEMMITDGGGETTDIHLGASSSSRRTSLTIQLPDEVEFETVPDIDEVIAAALSSSTELKREIVQGMLTSKYITRLLDLFRIAEDLDARETLFKLYSIFKNLILFNNPNLLRELLLDQNVISVSGVFEYDPHYPDVRPGYRNFLLERHRFKQILPLESPQLVDLIHQTFRLQFMKDVVLPRILDEETFGSLLFMTRCNFAEIIEILEGEEDMLSKLLPLFQQNADIDAIQVLKFVKEFLTMAKTSAAGRPLRIYQEGTLDKFLEFLQRQLADKSAEVRSLAVEVLICITQHDANIIRHFMIESKRRIPLEEQLLSRLIDRVIDEKTDVGLRWQIVAILRTLLDTGIIFGLSIPSDDFLNVFYPDYALQVFSPLASLDGKRASSIANGSFAIIDVYYNCVELLCSFIVQHKYRMKYLFFRPWIVTNALNLIKAPPKTLRISAVRLVRTMIGTGDDFYYRVLIKQNLLRPIVELAISLGREDSALVSSLRELFHHIIERRQKMLIFHLVETLRNELARIQFAPIAEELQACYDLLLNPQSSSEIDRPSNGEINRSNNESNRSSNEIRLNGDATHHFHQNQEDHLDLENTSAPLNDSWSRVDSVEEAYFDSLDNDYADDDDSNNKNHGSNTNDAASEGDEEGLVHHSTGTEGKTIDRLEESLSAHPIGLDNHLTEAGSHSIELSGLVTTLPTEDSIDRNKRMKY